jgi:hypothetical protein
VGKDIEFSIKSGKNINNSNYCHRIIIILVDKYDLPVGDQGIILKRLLSKCSNYFVCFFWVLTKSGKLLLGCGR